MRCACPTCNSPASAISRTCNAFSHECTAYVPDSAIADHSRSIAYTRPPTSNEPRYNRRTSESRKLLSHTERATRRRRKRIKRRGGRGVWMLEGRDETVYSGGQHACILVLSTFLRHRNRHQCAEGMSRDRNDAYLADRGRRQAVWGEVSLLPD